VATLSGRSTRPPVKATSSWNSYARAAKNTIYRCGSQLVTVPRHREINEMTAIGIMADLEAELGKGWWKK
jgi:hypothetical protein